MLRYICFIQFSSRQNTIVRNKLMLSRRQALQDILVLHNFLARQQEQNVAYEVLPGAAARISDYVVKITIPPTLFAEQAPYLTGTGLRYRGLFFIKIDMGPRTQTKSVLRGSGRIPPTELLRAIMPFLHVPPIGRGRASFSRDKCGCFHGYKRSMDDNKDVRGSLHAHP